MKKQTIIMDFSEFTGEYFLKTEKKYAGWIAETFQESMDIALNDAQEEIRKQIQEYGCEGIHFLDSGDYRYLSKFWLKKVAAAISLIVFDHHTDMQESCFFGLLSCGSSVKEVWKQNSYVKEVCVVGPPKESMDTVQT